MKNRNLNNADDWATPPELYDELNRQYNFDFDPCPLFHDLDLWDGLKIDWGQRNFINPPYSDLKASGYLKSSFVKKAIAESATGKLCVCLLPVSTSTKLFHDHILPAAPEITFIRGRVKFIGVNTFGEKVVNKVGMHDSFIVVFDGRKAELKPENDPPCPFCVLYKEIPSYRCCPNCAKELHP